MQTRSLETRTAILGAASALFSHTGYDATGVAEICAAAGVSKGAFYHHFPSKQSLFMELLREWLDSIENALRVVEGQTGSVPEKILKMAQMSNEIFQEGQDRLPMFLEFWLQASRDPVIWQASIQPYHQFRDFFATLILRGIAEGSFRSVDPQVAAQSLVSLAVGLLLQSLIEPRAANWGEVIAENIRLYLEGLKRG